MKIEQHDKLLAASLADMANRRADNSEKAVAILMMAALLVAESKRNKDVAYFHFVASVKKTFDALADATLTEMSRLQQEQSK